MDMTHLPLRLEGFEPVDMAHLPLRLEGFEPVDTAHLPLRLEGFEPVDMTHLPLRLEGSKLQWACVSAARSIATDPACVRTSVYELVRTLHALRSLWTLHALP